MKKHYAVKKAAALCAAFIIALSAFSDAGSGRQTPVSADNGNYNEQLAGLKEQQAELDEKIAAADEKLAKEKDNFAALQEKYNALNDKIESVNAYALELEYEMAELDGKQLKTSAEIEEHEETISVLKEAYMQRIRTLYIAGGTNTYADVIIDSGDFFDVLMRTELVTRVAKHDKQELDALLDEYHKLQASKALLEDELVALAEKTQEYSDKQLELANEQAELVKLEEESGELIGELQAGRDELSASYDYVTGEYAKVSSLAATTTAATTTTAETTAGAVTSQTAAPDDPADTKATTTTKKTAEEPAPSQTTTAAPSQTTTAAPVTTTTKPATTTKATTKATTTTAAPAPVQTGDSSKINTVLSYAKSNVGGSYVWGGASYRACDCSGLVMLSFAQVGYNLPHYAASQANYGTTVPYSNMQPGDVIFFGGSSYSSIYHVAIYIGNGMMVHAQNSATGIVISNVATFSYYGNPITVIKRML